MKVWLVWASAGDYFERTEWPLWAFADEVSAKDECARLLQLWREITGPWQAGNRDSELRACIGGLLDATIPGSDIHDEPSFQVCEIEVRGSVGAS